MLYKLKLKESVVTIPTIGFNIETFKYNNFQLTLCDIGGQDKIRQLWQHYLHQINYLIFMIDLADKERFEEAKEELFKLTKRPDFTATSVLVLANKMDLEHTCSVSDLKNMFGGLTSKFKMHIQKCNAITGEGIYEGLNKMLI